ncbi:MAG: undecaprenyl-diphosphate phosphatase [Gemmatimonadota bacterium]|nr:undecaprenyl-diphosphate phosphatase [Gemmatimonadota bacterium]MEC9317093.1 undecaprenyl-diphosphate phosphatase [Gemmatimonadota bacterium]
MTALEAFVLGILQGATEFLPISSSGHLVMAQAVLDIEVPGVLFEVWVHLATLLSILLIYRNRIAELSKGILGKDRSALEYIALVGLATLPAVVAGLFLGDLVKVMFDSPVIPGVALLVTGGVLWTSRRISVPSVGDRPGWIGALVIGLVQAFALIPGISRSGTTVVTALWLGLKAEDAAAFSFLMAIPVILGATLLQLSEIGASQSLPTPTLLLAGAAAAFTGVLAIRTFITTLGKGSFHKFGVYCWIIGVLFLSYLWVK